MATEDFALKVWRLHPNACRLEPAEKTLQGTANRGAVRFCGPFTKANRSGWWVYPPVDIDITWHGGSEFEHELRTPYDNTDRDLVWFLADEEDREHMTHWSGPEGRTKFTWGLVEPGVVQIWTGCIFETPPGWGLHVRSPVNMPPRAFHVMEAVLETDWLQYDIWLNVAFDRPGEKVEIRRESGEPIAQLVPIRRESYDDRWRMTDEMVNRNSEDAERVFRYWLDYNRKKFAGTGTHPIPDTDATKDSTTYYKERKRILKQGGA